MIRVLWHGLLDCMWQVRITMTVLPAAPTVAWNAASLEEYGSLRVELWDLDGALLKRSVPVWVQGPAGTFALTEQELNGYKEMACEWVEELRLSALAPFRSWVITS